MSKIKIITDGCHARIYADGIPLTSVRSYELKHEAGDLPVLTVTFANPEIETTLTDMFWNENDPKRPKCF
jgi:hypothetical protein